MANAKSSHTANAPNHQCCSSGSHSVPHCLAENIIALSETDSAWMPLKSNEGKSYIKGPSYYCKCIPKTTLVVNYFMRAPSFTITRLCLFFWHFFKYKCIVSYLGCALKWCVLGRCLPESERNWEPDSRALLGRSGANDRRAEPWEHISCETGSVGSIYSEYLLNLCFLRQP